MIMEGMMIMTNEEWDAKFSDYLRECYEELGKEARISFSIGEHYAFRFKKEKEFKKKYGPRPTKKRGLAL